MISQEEKVLVIAVGQDNFVLVTKMGGAMRVYTAVGGTIKCNFNEKYFMGLCAGLTLSGFDVREVNKKWGELDEASQKEIKRFVPSTQESILTAQNQKA